MDHYTLLGLSHECTVDEIKTAYKRVALKYHPDKPDGDREKFSAVERAYKTLLDPFLRAAYDNELLLSAKLQHPVWQVVTIPELELEEKTYFMNCRCGARMQVEGTSLEKLPALIECDDCSTLVRIDPTL